MVAMLLMGMAIALFSSVYPAATQGIYRSRHLDLARNACQAYVEALRNAGYNSIPGPSSGQSVATNTWDTSLVALPSDLPAPSGTWTCTKVDTNYAATTSDSGRYRIDVSLSWASWGVDRGTVTLTTLVVK